MFLLEDAVVTSPSDLSAAAKCEFAWVRQLDAKRGLIRLEAVARDAMEARAAELGDGHESRYLQLYRDQYGDGVVEFARPVYRLAELRAAAAATAQAFRNQAQVVFQAVFFDETDPKAPLVGLADFIVRQPDGRYRVQDTKLARSVKVTALLQLAAYYEQLVRLGIPADDTVELILGNDEVSAHDVHEILPVYGQRRARLVEIARERMDATSAAEWGDERYEIDGRCDLCGPEVLATRDVLMVASLRLAQRAKLRAAGIATIDQLAASVVRPSECGVPERTFATLRDQAALQVSVPADADPHSAPPFVMFAPQVLRDLPVPDAGDIFFDFEGDPLFSERASGSVRWGIDYLFGLVDNDEEFTAFWAHDLTQEKQALVDFLDFVVARRTQHPNMHIYHYASYERTHLLSIAARHKVGEHVVDELLREGVFVDLYPVVRKSVRVGGRSYSIKKLEPLYMGTELRSDDGVTNAADSITQYDLARQAELRGDAADGQAILNDIADYNRYDCVSTLRLRDWLLQRASELGVQPGTTPEVIERAPFEPSPLAGQLQELADAAGSRGDLVGEAAYELASAAVDYHRREDKSFWWEHYARLEYPIDEWENTRGVFLVDSGEVVDDWLPKRTRSSRTLRLRGTWAPGSGTSSNEAFTLYEPPVPFVNPQLRSDYRLPVSAMDVRADDLDPDIVTVTEFCHAGEAPWTRLPLAITPGPPPPAAALAAAIAEVAANVCADAPAWPRSAVSHILLRQPSRTLGGALAVAHAPADTAGAVISSVLDLDNSFIAVQGPPGTGKTYLGSRVIRDLVRDHGWQIGVVAQSHKVVENVLRGVVAAGLPATLVGKTAPTDAAGSYASEPFTELARDAHRAFAVEHADTGYVIGGTAWDFTNTNRFDRGQLDLLVIDEAGQFSLAATIAVSVAARNLLLLGDPQQLPQVSQGTHPAPVDQSALGYIADGRAVLPAEFGYFLAESWRMHSAVTAPVSRLSYDGELRSNPAADQRMLAGIAPGLHPVRVPHDGNATHSIEEAAVVVSLVADHLGRPWSDGGDRTAVPLTEADIIVVTPYNAQVETIRVALDGAGFTQVRVGTVDKYQGQEAAVSIMSLAASSPADVPRGLSFLLSRNRLNVAISRAQWAAYLLYSPRLIDYLPPSQAEIAELSRFIQLVSPASA